MYSYRAFGLDLLSDIPLPELPPGDGDASVTIRLDIDLLPLPPQITTSLRSVWRAFDRQEAVLHFPQAGQFTMRCGREVAFQPAADSRASLVRLLLLGPVMGALLYQRGKLVLHASAVKIGSGAVAFLGPSGCGKSSLAAAFHQRGCSLLTDDLTAIDLQVTPPVVIPGFPRLKVNPEVANALGHEPAALSGLDPLERKRAWPVAHGYHAAPLAVRRLYLLEQGAAQEITSIAPRQAVLALLRHSYPIRALQPGEAYHLEQCGQLVRQISIKRLIRTEQLSSLGELASQVQADLDAE